MRYLVIISLSLLITSCTEKIDLNLNEQLGVALVVDAMIDDLPGQDSVLLSFTTNFSDTLSGNEASGAQVRIVSKDREYIFLEKQSQPGCYMSPMDFIGKVGNDYRLEISLNGSNYHAETTLFPVPPIDSLGQERLPPDDFFDPNELKIRISFQDPGDEKNFYWFRERVNDTLYYESLSEYGAIFRDLVVNGEYLDQIEYGTFELMQGDTVEVEIMSISEEVYLALGAIMEESDFRGGFFDPPPSNVPTNIQGDKAFGLFVASSINNRKMIVTE